MWDKFVKHCPNHLKKEGAMALRAPLKSGFQWDPVLKDIVNHQCPNIYLTRCPGENMPAFMVAATCSKTQSFCTELGKSFPQQYDAYRETNTIQNMHLLLRANPAMILPTSSAPPEKGGKKRKANKKPPRSTKQSKRKNKC
jgi:hypothetical protein